MTKEEKILKNVLHNENFIFVSKEHSALEKLSKGLKKNITPPLSISRFLDKVNQIINQIILYLQNNLPLCIPFLLSEIGQQHY